MVGPLPKLPPLPPPDEIRPRLQRGVQWLAGHSLNQAAVGVLRLGLPFPPYDPGSALVLETFGRRSGKRRLTPLGCLQVADRVLVVAEHGRKADWLRNALAAGTVRIWLAGRPLQGRVHVLDADPEALLERMNNKIHAATIHAMAHDPCVVAIDLIDPPPPTGPASGPVA